MNHLCRVVVIAISLAILTGIVQGQADSGKLTINVVDKKTGKPAPCRIHLKDAAGKAQKAEGLPNWNDHFVCPGSVRLDLPPGEYTYEVERGPEWSRRSGTITVKANDAATTNVELERLVDLPAEGWWPADMHIHRPVDDVELLMRAEDLHIAPVITWWNKRNHWKTVQRLPERLLHQIDGNRYYHVMGGEDEREGGALLYFNLPGPMAIAEASREFPSPVKFLREARRQKTAWIDVEKPFWWDVPVWLATGEVDSIGLANNHMCRDKMYESEAWGRARDAKRLPPPLGNSFWTQEIYYHILNCGLRVPPSAGSASGVLPNPVGYNRVYVHTGADFTYEKWWEALRAGRSFVTNGPLLRVAVDGKLPGHVFTADEGQELSLDVKLALTSREPIPFIEIIKDGQVERRVPFEEWSKKGTLGKLSFKSSGWFLVRAIADNPKTFRFASTAPYHVEIGASKRRVSKASAQFFAAWVEQRMGRIKLDDPEQRKEVLRHHQIAEKFWQDVAARANVD